MDALDVQSVSRCASRQDLKRLVAPTLAALSRVNLNARPYRLARWLVECTLARGVNFMFAPRLDFIAGPLKFNKSEVHEILHGYKSSGQPVAGLVEIGFVRVRECALDRGWLLIIQPDASRWDVAAVFSAEDHARRLADVDAVRLAFAQQLESREIAEWFPDLKAVLDDVSLDNALRAAGGGDGAASDAREVRTATDHGVAAPRVPGDARGFHNPKPPGSRVSCGSESLNATQAENSENQRSVQKFRTGLTVNRQQKPITVQQLNCSVDVDGERRLMTMIREQFGRVLSAAQLNKEMVNYGGAWRKTVRYYSEQTELSLAELRSRIDARSVKWPPAWLSRDILLQLGFEDWPAAYAAAEKFKESLSSP